MIKNIMMAAILFLSSGANAWSPFGPKNFDECILNGMKGVTSDVAAGACQGSCRLSHAALS